MTRGAATDARTLRVAMVVLASAVIVAALWGLQWFLSQPPRPGTRAMRDLQDAAIAALYGADRRELDLAGAASADTTFVCVALEYEEPESVVRNALANQALTGQRERLPEHQSALIFVMSTGRTAATHLPAGASEWALIERRCLPIEAARLDVLGGPRFGARLRFHASARH